MDKFYVKEVGRLQRLFAAVGDSPWSLVHHAIDAAEPRLLHGVKPWDPRQGFRNLRIFPTGRLQRLFAAVGD